MLTTQIFYLLFNSMYKKYRLLNKVIAFYLGLFGYNDKLFSPDLNMEK